jgi:hypothetical protein
MHYLTTKNHHLCVNFVSDNCLTSARQNVAALTIIIHLKCEDGKNLTSLSLLRLGGQMMF